MNQDEEIAAIRDAGEHRYERVCHEPQNNGTYKYIEGWTATLEFPGNSEPMIAVANPDETRRIPIDRVLFTETRDPPGTPGK